MRSRIPYYNGGVSGKALFQSVMELLGGLVASGRVGRAGFADRVGKLLVCPGGRREHFSIQTPHICAVDLSPVRHWHSAGMKRICLAQWRDISVEKCIKSYPERINVDSIVVFVSEIDLRCHILDRPDPAHGPAFVDGVHGPGDPEIAQLIPCSFPVKNVARLDIPVEDPQLLAAAEGITNIHAQPDDLFTGEISISLDQVLFQSNQLFHPDQNGADLFAAEDGIVLNGDDIGRPFELHHGIDLCTHSADEVFQSIILTAFAGNVRIENIPAGHKPHGGGVSGIVRLHLEHFQRTSVTGTGAEIIPEDFIDFSIGAFSQYFSDLPVWPY